MGQAQSDRSHKVTEKQIETPTELPHPNGQSVERRNGSSKAKKKLKSKRQSITKSEVISPIPRVIITQASEDRLSVEVKDHSATNEQTRIISEIMLKGYIPDDGISLGSINSDDGTTGADNCSESLKNDSDTIINSKNTKRDSEGISTGMVSMTKEFLDTEENQELTNDIEITEKINQSNSARTESKGNRGDEAFVNLESNCAPNERTNENLIETDRDSSGITVEFHKVKS